LLFKHTLLLTTAQGVTANAAGSAVSWGTYFFGYERIKESMRDSGDVDVPLRPDQHMRAALMAGMVTAVVGNPIWVVKTRMCLQAAELEVAPASAAGANAVRGARGLATVSTSAIVAGGSGHRYRGLVDGLSSIWRHEGLAGLYKGIVPALWSTMHGSVQFVIYEDLKRRRNEAAGADFNTKLPTTDYIVSHRAFVAWVPLQLFSTFQHPEL
jgi:solute carrier family 25 folate transporter 32